jgi:hypothetical protein
MQTFTDILSPCLQAKQDKEEARRAKLAQKEAQRLQAKQLKEKEKV